MPTAAQSLGMYNNTKLQNSIINLSMMDMYNGSKLTIHKYSWIITKAQQLSMFPWISNCFSLCI